MNADKAWREALAAQQRGDHDEAARFRDIAEEADDE